MVIGGSGSRALSIYIYIYMYLYTVFQIMKFQGYPLVICHIANWKITIFKFGKSTISMSHWKITIFKFSKSTISTNFQCKVLVITRGYLDGPWD